MVKGYDENGKLVPKIAHFRAHDARVRLLQFYLPKPWRAS
jgi:hypothetical protein